MLAPKGFRFNWWYSNFSGSASSVIGTSVTPGASNAEGSWTQIVSAANCANDVYELCILVHAGTTSATDKSHLLDIGIDPAGGTSYTPIVSNIVCGLSQFISSGAKWFRFPIRIPAGSTIAARVQGVAATAGTVRVCVAIFGKPSRPELCPIGSYSETIGTVNSGSQGVSVTPGSTNVEGSWTSLGTTSKDLWWWQLSIQCSNATITALNQHFDLAFGDVTNKQIILQDEMCHSAGTAETLTCMAPPNNFYCEVPAGSELFVRGMSSGAPVTGWNVLAHGVGG